MPRLLERTHKGNRIITALVVIAAVAVLSPLAAQAKTQRLAVQIVAPLVFLEPTHDCPEGGATFGARTHAGGGSGSVCFKAIRPASFPCHSDVGCQEVDSLLTLNLRGGTIVAEQTQFETFAFDPETGVFTVFLSIAGRVTKGTGKFHSLVGAPVSGGGRTDIAPDGTATPQIELVIG